MICSAIICPGLTRCGLPRQDLLCNGLLSRVLAVHSCAVVGHVMPYDKPFVTLFPSSNPQPMWEAAHAGEAVHVSRCPQEL